MYLFNKLLENSRLHQISQSFYFLIPNLLRPPFGGSYQRQHQFGMMVGMSFCSTLAPAPRATDAKKPAPEGSGLFQAVSRQAGQVAGQC